MKLRRYNGTRWDRGDGVMLVLKCIDVIGHAVATGS